MRSKKISVFSLIELSLTLIVLSSLATVAIIRFTTEEKISKNNEVLSDFDTLRKAIDNYVAVHNYYPCPAGPAVPETDQLQYGTEMRQHDGLCTAGSMGTYQTGYPAGFRDSDMTDILESEYGIALGKNATTNSINPTVIPNNSYDYPSVPAKLYFGAVPCKTLGLPRDCGKSPNGDNYTYAVSGQLSKPIFRLTPGWGQEHMVSCSHFVVPGSGGPLDLDIVRVPDPVRVLGRFEPDNVCASQSGTPDAYGAITATWWNHTDSYPAGDYALVYHGPDGIGAWNQGSAQKRGRQIAGGPDVYIGDNYCQAINHKMFFDPGLIHEYFLMPRTPYGSRVVFGDIVYAGKSNRMKPNICVSCRLCDVTSSWPLSSTTKVFIWHNSTPTTDIDPATADPVTDPRICNGGVPGTPGPNPISFWCSQP